MARVITFGEIMMRLNPEGYQRFVQADKFEASYAGGGNATLRFPLQTTGWMRLLFQKCLPMKSVNVR